MTEKSKLETLLLDAAEWRLLSLLLTCPSTDRAKEIRGLAGEIEDQQLMQAARFSESQASEGLYHAIFGPGGPAPAREVSYRDWVQPGYLLSELSAYYDAFSYAPKKEETPDHIAVEADFIAFLRMKEAFAMATGDLENAEITSNAATGFIRDHLSKMSERMATTLSESEIDYLVLASTALFQRVGPDEDRAHGRALPVLANPEEDVYCSD